MSGLSSAPSSHPANHARYARQVRLPDLGVEGQERLAAGSVLVVGAGGLGSPALMHLAAAGVGRLVVVDPDVVEVSNLHRQLLYSEADIGRPKVEAAAERLRAMNPLIQVEAHQARFTASNAESLLSSSDLIIDGSDNFATRYLANDVAVLAGKPSIYGAVLRHEGQVSVFAPKAGGPCYRCLFPAPPPPGAVPT
jgi:sulfur-carrier protein adenylyltransferase/sulfurtransferase